MGYLGILGFTFGAVLAATGTAAVADDETPPPIVDTYDYPDAAKISAERHILLKKGNGHLLLVDCVAGGDFIEIRSRGRDPYCFEATGPSGWVTLELSDTFLVMNDSKHITVANYTVDGDPGSTTIEPGGAQGIGEGSTPDKSAILLELRATS